MEGGDSHRTEGKEKTVYLFRHLLADCQCGQIVGAAREVRTVLLHASHGDKHQAATLENRLCLRLRDLEEGLPHADSIAP